jgi:hypothetical protein
MKAILTLAKGPIMLKDIPTHVVDHTREAERRAP